MFNIHVPHCLDLDLNKRRRGATFDNGFIFEKKIKEKREKKSASRFGNYPIYPTSIFIHLDKHLDGAIGTL